MTELNIDIPIAIYDVLFSKSRYKILLGGRGSGKSWSIADYLIICALKGHERILCAREYQNSISESVHRLLSDRIAYFGLDDVFKITDAYIAFKPTDTDFMFKGLARDINSIKSTEGITKVWVEEAVNVSERSWDILIPTVFRRDNSEIIISFNPDNELDATYRLFCTGQKESISIAHVNYNVNRHFPAVLRKEMEECKRLDYDKYRHIWLGECTNFQGKVYKEYLRDKEALTLEPIFENDRVIGCIKEGERIIFQPYWNYYLGLDTGSHTGAVIKCIDEKGIEYIIDEVYDLDGLVRDIAGQITSKCQRRNVVGKVIDSASQVKREYEAQGLYCVDSCKDVLGSIAKVREKQSQHKWYVLNHCKSVIHELNTREWEEKPNFKGKIMPKKENDHLMNAEDYIQTTFLRADPPTIETPKINRFRQTMQYKAIQRQKEAIRIG